MDIEEIKTLTDLMIDNDLAEIMIRDGEKEILLRRGASFAPHQAAHLTPAAPVIGLTQAASAPPAEPSAAQPPGAPPAEEQHLASIKSPMVGTFYAAPDPASRPFVNVGDEITPDTVVCVIEAMKVFNEIKAEVAGVLESIEVENGRPVEFGQTLMKVRVP
jgi:acetyl-CoA carboxylase biotin carboxyl carrier protein